MRNSLGLIERQMSCKINLKPFVNIIESVIDLCDTVKIKSTLAAKLFLQPLDVHEGGLEILIEMKN